MKFASYWLRLLLSLLLPSFVIFRPIELCIRLLPPKILILPLGVGEKPARTFALFRHPRAKDQEVPKFPLNPPTGRPVPWLKNEVNFRRDPYRQFATAFSPAARNSLRTQWGPASPGCSIIGTLLSPRGSAIEQTVRYLAQVLQRPIPDLGWRPQCRPFSVFRPNQGSGVGGRCNANSTN